MQETPMTPNADQLKAIAAWQRLYGRTWKAELRHAWYCGNYNGFEMSGLLQQIRNQVGGFEYIESCPTPKTEPDPGRGRGIHRAYRIAK